MQEHDRFDTLGRLEDLPQTYRDELTKRNLVPLWPSLRGVLPPNIPTRKTQTTHWPYAEIRELLIRAGELTPIEKAERRVLVLANPGHGLTNMQASAAMYLGMQLLLPGEIAPVHRHTPNAVRMVVEGEGAWTLVGGEKCPMQRGDLILTPTGLWHEHGHDGQDPVIWLDVLDLPLVYYTETSYHLEGPSQSVSEGQGFKSFARGGLVPTPIFQPSSKAYPMLRYPWADAKAALLSLSEALSERKGKGEGESEIESKGEAVLLTYVNPETGADVENILGFYALMLRPAETLRLPARSPAQVFHQIEGQTDVQVEATDFTLVEADTCCAPGYTVVTLKNRSATTPAFLFVADEAPLHRKLGVYENRG